MEEKDARCKVDSRKYNILTIRDGLNIGEYIVGNCEVWK